MQKSQKMAETLAHGYSYDSTQQELYNEYQHDRVLNGFQNFLRSCAFDESRLSIKKVIKGTWGGGGGGGGGQ